ncbi:unnamed protein product [Mytilus edulis]|uniref:Uncharacterized protein n=1 Tax=Mytilus edulis TaxID=6550 RepID=A0A8S3S3V3_MYTED|nr:unnamed protein product [Mytilus edulis]
MKKQKGLMGKSLEMNRRLFNRHSFRARLCKFRQIKREKPNANIIALEGLILFTNNKTLHWLDQMETEKKTQIFKIARERAPAMLKQFKLRKEHIKNQHILLLKNKREEKLRKENSKQQELQSLTKDIEKIGGLWVTSQDINKNLKKLNETEKWKQ